MSILPLFYLASTSISTAHAQLIYQSRSLALGVVAGCHSQSLYDAADFADVQYTASVSSSGCTDADGHACTPGVASATVTDLLHASSIFFRFDSSLNTEPLHTGDTCGSSVTCGGSEIIMFSVPRTVRGVLTWHMSSAFGAAEPFGLSSGFDLFSATNSDSIDVDGNSQTDVAAANPSNSYDLSGQHAVTLHPDDFQVYIAVGSGGSSQSDAAWGQNITLQVSLILCPADFNLDGQTNVADIFAYLTAFFAENGQSGPSIPADINNSGTVSVDDIFAFLESWFAGCR